MLASSSPYRIAVRRDGRPVRATTARFEPRVLSVHLSAVLSGAAYFAGVVIAAVETPEMAGDIIYSGTGAFVLGGAFGVFMALALLIQRQMGISLTSSETATPPKLCTSGAFAVSRNPIYLIFTIPLLAIGYYSLAAAGITTMLYITAITVFVIRGEERVLTKMFGNEYITYCRNTPRWLFI